MDNRFAFGKNWKNYSKLINGQKIELALQSIQDMTGARTLAGKSFLDIGSGSGLFSLAAAKLGAHVFSFDYDPDSVDCTRRVRETFAADNKHWEIRQGSALDENFIRSLGTYDIVYSWGVLHHTGDMWKALDYAAIPVKPGGQLFISIYNDQGATSERWTAIKKFYNRAPAPARLGVLGSLAFYFAARSSVRRLLSFKNPFAFKERIKAQEQRGMNAWYDLVDWAGGYPFEVAKPEAIVDFYKKKGFTLEKLVTVGGGHGCNQFVFVRR